MPSTQTLIHLLITYRYWILLPIALLEGPVLSVTVGFLIHLGYFSFIPAYAIMVLGDFIPDTAYYYLGRFGNKKKIINKYLAKSKFFSKNFNLLDRVWNRHGFKTMFLSKLAYGLSTAFLITAGLVKMPIKKYWSYSVPITLIQYIVFMTLGYFMGYSYELVSNYIELATIVIAVIVVIFVTVYLIANRSLEKEMAEK
jgi:membrane protein DedA with SNARE-associated domain